MFYQKKYLLGQELVRRGKLSQENLDFALMEHERNGERLGRILLRCGFIQEQDLLEVLSDQLSLPIVTINEKEIPQAVLNKLPAKMVRELKVLPVEESADHVVICISDPIEKKSLEALERHLKASVKLVIDTDKNVLAAIKRYYGLTSEQDLEVLEE